MVIGQEYERVSMYEGTTENNWKWVGQVVKVLRISSSGPWFSVKNRASGLEKEVCTRVSMFNKHFRPVNINLENK